MISKFDYLMARLKDFGQVTPDTARGINMGHAANVDESLRGEIANYFAHQVPTAPKPVNPEQTLRNIYARLCEAAMHAFAAENRARMDTMSAARTNIERTLIELKQHENQVRQEEITAEIVELAASGQTSV